MEFFTYEKERDWGRSCLKNLAGGRGGVLSPLESSYQVEHPFKTRLKLFLPLSKLFFHSPCTSQSSSLKLSPLCPIIGPSQSAMVQNQMQGLNSWPSNPTYLFPAHCPFSSRTIGGIHDTWWRKNHKPPTDNGEARGPVVGCVGQEEMKIGGRATGHQRNVSATPVAPLSITRAVTLPAELLWKLGVPQKWKMCSPYISSIVAPPLGLLLSSTLARITDRPWFWPSWAPPL